jgi:hypothetical protein
MSGPPRRRAFLLAATTVCGAVLLIGALTRRGADSDPRARSPEPVGRLESAPLSPARSRSSGRRQRPSRARARQQARRFLAAFLRYQRGEVRSRVRRELAATTETRFARYLARAPALPIRARATRGRISELRLYGPVAGEMKASATLVYRGREEPSLFEFVLRRHRSSWRVAELYP